MFKTRKMSRQRSVLTLILNRDSEPPPTTGRYRSPDKPGVVGPALPFPAYWIIGNTVKENG